MASTRTDYLSGIVAQKLGNDLIKAENTISLAAKNSVASDVIQAIAVPKGAYVMQVGVYLKTAEGVALTATVGDGAGAAAWDASTDLNAAAGTVTGGVPGTDAYATSGKLYTAADTIDLTMSAAAGDAAVFTVFAIYAIIEAVANA